MAKITFETLSFKQEPEHLRVNLLKIFYTRIPLAELQNLGEFEVEDHSINFPSQSEKKVAAQFASLLGKYVESSLVNQVSGNKSLYIHRNSGIPLLGNVAFGIVYRNTSLIEIKPVTSCNLDCIYCSVGEGKSSKKMDVVVEKDYLLEELYKLMEFVQEPVEIHIGVQGEPFLYADLLPLIADLQQNPQVMVISTDTNFTLVTKAMLDQMAHCPKLRLNISLDALDPKIADVMSGCHYNLDKVLEMIRYAVQKRINILIAPVFVPGYNETELEKIIAFVKELDIPSLHGFPFIGIQNFLPYKTGRNPTKSMPWDKFYAMLEGLEKKTNVKLKLDAANFSIHKTKILPAPFKEGDVVTAQIKAPDRFPRSSLAAAKERTISVAECSFKKDKKVRIKIIRDKHNIFGGKVV